VEITMAYQNVLATATSGGVAGVRVAGATW
jgi:hypothetical protein